MKVIGIKKESIIVIDGAILKKERALKILTNYCMEVVQEQYTADDFNAVARIDFDDSITNDGDVILNDIAQIAFGE